MVTTGSQPRGEDTSYPYAKSAAAIALSRAIDAISEKEGVSLRSLGGRLGYKSAVVLSHMRTGRLPVPIDRAGDIAEAVNLDPGQFLMAVLEQRYPAIDFAEALATGRAENTASPQGPARSPLVADLEEHAALPFDELPATTVAVLREVVSDPRPRRRWLGVSEATVVDVIRAVRPDLARDGINAQQAKSLADFIKNLR